MRLRSSSAVFPLPTILVASLALAAASARADEIDANGSWQVHYDCSPFAEADSVLAISEDVSTGALTAVTSECGGVVVPGADVAVLSCTQSAGSEIGQVFGGAFNLPAAGFSTVTVTADAPFPFPGIGCLTDFFESDIRHVGTVSADAFGVATRVHGLLWTGQLTVFDTSGFLCLDFPDPPDCLFEMRRNDVPAGTDVFVQPRFDAAVTFASVLTPGILSVTTTTTGAAALPDDFEILTEGGLPVFYEIASTATTAGVVTTCLTYPDADNNGFLDGTAISEFDVALLHEEGPVFVDRTVGSDQTANVVCAETTGLSQFALGGLVVPPPPPVPGITNGGFETGDFTGWGALSRASVTTGAVGSGPTEGAFQALLTTSGSGAFVSQLETFVYGSPTGALVGVGNGFVQEGSAIKQTFIASAGEFVTFRWNFLTNETTLSPRDFAFAVFDGATVKLADNRAEDGFSPTPFFTETGFRPFQFEVPADGVYTLALGVVDVGSTSIDSALLVDDVAICTGDADGDGVVDCIDECDGAGGFDADGDGACDLEDNCPDVFNATQADGDGDGIGDACDGCVGPGPIDTDGDLVCDPDDNCVVTANADQADADGDGFGDACPPVYSLDLSGGPLRILNAKDATTQATIPLTAPASIFSARGLALQPGTGTLYALLAVSGFGNLVLSTIDPATGAVSLIGQTKSFLQGLAFTCEGTLYSVDTSGTDRLHVVDPTTAASSPVTTLGTGDSFGALAFHSGTELLYRATFSGLEEIDPLALVPPFPIRPLGGDSASTPLALTHLGFLEDDLLVTDGFRLQRLTTDGVRTTLGFPAATSGGLAPLYPEETCPSGPRCRARPQVGCVESGRAKVMVQESRPGREKAVFKLDRMLTQTLQQDFGDPVGGDTGYAICVYDEADRLAAELAVDRSGEACGAGACWRATGTTGFKYRDRTGSASGILTLAMRSGPAGAGSIKAVARNNAGKGLTALPSGIATALAGSHRATLQVRTTERACFAADIPVIRQADAFHFKGLLP